MYSGHFYRGICEISHIMMTKYSPPRAPTPPSHLPRPPPVSAYYNKSEVFAQELALPEGKALVQQLQKLGMSVDKIKANTDLALGFMSEKLTSFFKANKSHAGLNKAWNLYIASREDKSNKANLGMKSAEKGYFDFGTIETDSAASSPAKAPAAKAKAPAAPAKAAKAPAAPAEEEEYEEDEHGMYIKESGKAPAKKAAGKKAPAKVSVKPPVKAVAVKKAAGKGAVGPGRPPNDIEASIRKHEVALARMKMLKAARDAAAEMEEESQEAEEDEAQEEDEEDYEGTDAE